MTKAKRIWIVSNRAQKSQKVHMMGSKGGIISKFAKEFQSTAKEFQTAAKDIQ